MWNWMLHEALSVLSSFFHKQCFSLTFPGRFFFFCKDSISEQRSACYPIHPPDQSNQTFSILFMKPISAAWWEFALVLTEAHPFHSRPFSKFVKIISNSLISSHGLTIHPTLGLSSADSDTAITFPSERLRTTAWVSLKWLGMYVHHTSFIYFPLTQ